MPIGKRGENSGKTVWLQLDGKTGVLTAWNRAEQKEDEFAFVAGMVTDARIKEKDYGVKGKGYAVSVTFEDKASNERYIVESGAGSRVTTRLLGQLAAADLSQPVYLAPYLMKQGDVLQSGETVNQDTVMTAVKMVLGVNGDKLDLSEGVKPHYGDKHDKLPAPVGITKADGSPLIQNGQQMMDRSEIEALCADLVDVVNAKAKGQSRVQQQTQGEGDGVDADALAAATGAADRGAMRARG